MEYDPRDYELFAKAFYERLLRDLGEVGVQLKHRAKYTGLSGQEYEIDLSYEKSWDDIVDILVLFECKAYARRVKVTDLLVFSEKLKDLRASKGVFVTTVGFEKGAYVVARANKIALAVLRSRSGLGRLLAMPGDKIPESVVFVSHMHDVGNPITVVHKRKRYDRFFERLSKTAFDNSGRTMNFVSKSEVPLSRLVRLLRLPADIPFIRRLLVRRRAESDMVVVADDSLAYGVLPALERVQDGYNPGVAQQRDEAGVE